MLVKAKKKGARTTYSNHSYAVAENQIKNLSITQPRQVLVSDITYLSLKEGSFAYLFLTTDLYSRKIVGYHLSRDLTHHSAIYALGMAIEKYGEFKNAIHHSDRGTQYCCHSYLNFLKSHTIIPSMTDQNHCYQNAVAERVNGILKDEFNLDQTFPDFQLLKNKVTDVIHIYNSTRTHFSLNLKTPDQVFQ